MTYPITPNPAIHVQPADIGSQQMLYTGGQLQTWAQNLPLAMTLQLVDAILTAFGATPDEISEINADATTFYDGVESWLTTSNANTQAFLTNLSAALQQSWLSFQNLLNGIVQETDADVAAAITWLQGIGTAANNALTQIEDFLTTGDWSDLSTAMQDILQSIFGSSTSLGLVGSIPAPAVVNVTQNLQPVWDFPDAASLSGAGTAWSWDGSEDHTGTAGSGSAKVVANGVLQALKGIPGAVQPAQVVTPTAYVMWSGLTYTGSNPIQLQLIPYSQSGSELVAGTASEVAQIASPASSGSWTHLTGTYTVPSSGVAAVQLRLVVGGNATAGSVWWDDCEANLSGGFLADLQSDTNNIIDSFAPSGTSAEFLTGVTNLLALFGLTPADIGGATVIETVWTDIINDFINPLNAIEQSAINGLTDVWDWLTGTPTPTSSTQVAATKVTNVLGGSSLGADVSTVHTTVGTVSTTATNASTWSTRLTNDLLVLSDVFHLTYAVGTSTDPPGTLSGGKPTWYSCWNDLLALCGIVNSTTAPTDIAPTTGASITAASAAATTAGTNASMAISSASTANTTAQAITDGIFQSQNGGSSTGNATSTIVPSLTNIPASNVVGGTGAAVTFGAVGGGNINATAANPKTITETHTILTGDGIVYTVVPWLASSSATCTSAVTYGGTAMSLVERQLSSAYSSQNLYLEVWQLKAPASGSQTVSATVTASTGSVVFEAIASASYAATKTVASSGNTGGGSTSLTMSQASATNHMVLGVFVIDGNAIAPTLSAFTQTSRKSLGPTGNKSMIVGDAVGASSVSFGVTSSTAGPAWVGITVDMSN